MDENIDPSPKLQSIIIFDEELNRHYTIHLTNENIIRATQGNFMIIFKVFLHEALS